MNSLQKKQRIVIAGGGTAGWMAAAALAKLLGKNLDITLIESDEIGTVGVGEATIPTLHIFHQLLGLKENEIMAATNATFKLGISFENWRDVNEDYIHSFGFPGKDCWAAQFHHFWLKGLQKGIEYPIGDYCKEHLGAREHKFAVHPDQELNHAYHMDATLYAKYLRGFAEKYGVRRVEGKIADVKLCADNGHIESLLLESGEVFAGDLFIDCTGFAALLIEKSLHTGYDDWSHWLPCDRAIAVQTESTGELLPYTRSIARESGWQWRIPLQNRTGNGFVFCSRYMSDEEAITTLTTNVEGALLTKPRVIPFRTGTRRKHWHKNCVALGLAAGFIEPLESTSIHLIQRSIVRLMLLFPSHGIQDSNVDEFNAQTTEEMEFIRDFIVLHYKVTNRTDSKFWRHCRTMSIPDSLKHRLDLFIENSHVYKHERDLFGVSSWVQVMLGQGILPKRYHPIVDLMGEEELKNFLATIRLQVSESVNEWPHHADFIRDYCSSVMTDSSTMEPVKVEQKMSPMPESDVKSLLKDDEDFAIDQQPNLRIKKIGNTKTPLIIVDNITKDFGRKIRAHAATAVFTPEDKNLYPGIRAELPLQYVKAVISALGKDIYEIYDIPKNLNLKVTQAVYSLITKEEGALSVLQRMPHFDTAKPYSFAILHYISEGQHGDTGFFRHNPTGLEKIYAIDEDRYFKSAKDFFAKNDLPQQTYFTEGNEHYSLHERIDYMANRLAIYPGNLLHSVLVDTKKDISKDLLKGRLTANIFIDFE